MMDDLTISDAPIPADQWLRLTVDALKDLGGALQMVRLAKRQRMKVASANGGDWRGAEVGCPALCIIYFPGWSNRSTRYPSYGCRRTRRKHAAMPFRPTLRSRTPHARVNATTSGPSSVPLHGSTISIAGVWCDSRELEFRHGVHHGYHGLPSWRKQKFTFHFPDGFHFDVKHYRDRKFSLDDRKGKLQQFARYTNIDPHGFVRRFLSSSEG